MVRAQRRDARPALGILRFEVDPILWPLIIGLPTCLIGFLVPYISMRRWSRGKHESGGPMTTERCSHKARSGVTLAE